MGVYEDAFPLHDGNISPGFKREIPKSSVENSKSESLSRFPTIKIMYNTFCEIENFHPKFTCDLWDVDLIFDIN